MKQFLTDKDRIWLDQKIAEAEKLTRTQIVLATVKRCDNYPEIPWKAFAIGASISAFLIFLSNLFMPEWITDTVIIFSIAIVLATGILFTFLTILIPSFARLFISKSRKETESLQYAEALFLSRELFATEGRRGILLLVSQFERQVVILPDKGVRDRLSNDIMKNIILKMTLPLKHNQVSKSFETGLEELVAILNQQSPKVQDNNELSNEIIEEDGV